MSKTVKQAMGEWLKCNGFDGLYYIGCFDGGCTMDSLMDCPCPDAACQAAYKHPDGSLRIEKPEGR